MLFSGFQVVLCPYFLSIKVEFMRDCVSALQHQWLMHQNRLGGSTILCSTNVHHCTAQCCPIHSLMLPDTRPLMLYVPQDLQLLNHLGEHVSTGAMKALHEPSVVQSSFRTNS